MPEVALIGVGHTGKSGLWPGAVEHILTADVLVGGERLLSLFPDAPGERWVLNAKLDETLNRVAAESNRRKIAVLASGDPLFFGIGRKLLANLGQERVIVFPQISSMQYAFSKIGESWEDARMTSAHGRPLTRLAAQLRRASKAMVLTDPRNTPSAVAAALLEDGQADWQGWVCEALGYPEESFTFAPITDLKEKSFHLLNLLILLRPSLPERPEFGLPDEEFDCRRLARGLITKSEVRAVALARLRLRNDSVFWDVGAGSGAISIEAALLAPEGEIFAIERNSESVAHIRANIARHRVPFVRVVEGYAPDALTDLPDPDRIFIGGSDGKLKDILSLCSRRLRKGGRIVVSAATLETLSIARESFPESWNLDVVMVQAARGIPVGRFTRFQSVNPIFLFIGAPPNSEANLKEPQANEL